MVSLIKTTVMLFISTACLGQVFTSFQTSQPQIKVEFHRAEFNPGEGLIEVTAPYRNEKVYIYPKAIITNKDIIEASVVEGTGVGVRPHKVLSMTFTKEAAERMTKLTALHIGESLALLIDGKVVSVARIAQEIHDKAQVPAEISKEEAKRIAETFNPVRNNNEKDEVIPTDEGKYDDVKVVKRNQIQLAKVTNEDFQNSVLKSRELVLVFFWAKWCQPAQMMVPTIKVIADKYKGKMKVFQLDVDEDNETARQYDLKGLPAIILFSAGSEIDRIVGATSQGIISRMIDRTKQ
jgi:thioredoxin 1